MNFQLRSRKWVRIVLPVAFVLVLAASVLLVNYVKLPGEAAGSTKPEQVSAADYRKSLQAQVDNKDGSPVSGRDPATQSQTSLTAAASTPSGTGTRTSAPAAGTAGSASAKASPSQVYGTNGDQHANGINDSGCFYDYGKPGQECLAAHVANADGTVTCADVRGHGGFPNGIKVSGTDRFKLDTNKNGVACDAGDK